MHAYIHWCACLYTMVGVGVCMRIYNGVHVCIQWWLGECSLSPPHPPIITHRPPYHNFPRYNTHLLITHTLPNHPIRSPHIPKMNLSVTRHSMLSAAWPPGLPWPVVACEDSCLRGITINDKGVLSHKHVKNVVPECMCGREVIMMLEVIHGGGYELLIHVLCVGWEYMVDVLCGDDVRTHTCGHCMPLKQPTPTTPPPPLHTHNNSVCRVGCGRIVPTQPPPRGCLCGRRRQRVTPSGG